MRQAFPVATTIQLPVSGIGHSALPVIFLQNATGSIELSLAALEWASNLSSELRSVSVRKHVSTLCNFFNFHHLYAEEQARTAKAQALSILAYIDFRVSGTEHLENENPLSLLSWKGVSKTTVRSEFNHLQRFFRWLEISRRNIDNNLNMHFFPTSGLIVHELKKFGDHDFFKHLAANRKHWEDLAQYDKLDAPRRLRPTPRNNRFRPFPPEEEIKAIIASEQNPTFKAIWLLQSYGASHRISEILNIWQEDILPPSYSRNFFGFSTKDMPVVLIAHPSESTWLGGFTDNRLNRLQFMLQRYGVRPRSERPSSDPQYAGFKGKRLFGQHLVANSWWLNMDAAMAFQECVDQIEVFHRRNKTSQSHPYAFVNMYAKGDRRGEPISYKRISSAWNAACKRVGITPNRNGRNIHGLRHFQKWQMEQMGISSSQIQVIRGDSSIASQNEYGKCAASIANALNKTTTHT